MKIEIYLLICILLIFMHVLRFSGRGTVIKKNILFISLEGTATA